MNRTSVLSIAVVLLCAACGSAPPSGTPAVPGGAASAGASSLPSTQPSPSPLVPAGASPSAAASTAAQPDYTGDWGGVNLAGTVKYCGSTANPYWAADMVSGSGDRGFMSFLIPAGSTAPIAGIIDMPFIVDEFNAAAAGTGQFVPGNPPHFIIVNGEGTYDITLQVGTFCNTN